MNYAVIMAGGSGQRLWPLSRRDRPKQVLKLLGGQTLLGQCYERIRPLFEPERIFVLTNGAYVDLVRKALPELSSDHVIAEPMVRDTTAAIGLAATILQSEDPQAIMAVLTADHVIEPGQDFLKVLQDALKYVNGHQKVLVTFGVKPTYAATQYGYIKCGPAQAIEGYIHPVHTVLAFTEKPCLEVARQYVESGDVWWNSGMFVWRASTILENLMCFLPESTSPLQQLGEAWGNEQWDCVLKRCFSEIPKISIDFAVMEKATEVVALPLPCHWLDLGSFTSLKNILPVDGAGNVISGATGWHLDTCDSVLVSEIKGHLIASIGLKGMLVAHSADATLVCPLDQLDRLKELLATLETPETRDYL